MDRNQMDALTQNMKTKSQKIRALFSNGVSKADIARYLEIRYQHVRNVLMPIADSERSHETVLAETVVPQASLSLEDGLTIDEAKRGLSIKFGVPVEAIEIVIRG